MNLRTLTGFVDPGWPVEPPRIEAMATCLKKLRDALHKADYVVQTLRLATPPPAEMSKPVPPAKRPDLARRLEAECFVHGLDYVSIGPALPEETDGFTAIPRILGAAESVFTSAVFATYDGGLSLAAARACGQAIQEIATLTADGFTNLRFAALANVAPGAAFFPAAYHSEGSPAVAIGTEGAELAVDALRNVASPATARRRLVGMIEAHAAALTRITQPVTTELEVRFLGLDFSMITYPEELRSLGAALENFGLPAVGRSGTTAAAAFLADCLDQAEFRRTGFCGLTFPVLEDSTLAARAATGTITISDLLLYSTVCGTGLDTIPLPGNISPEALTAILIDVGALALRHNKPLTARLMPIPGKSAGDPVHFDFPYFADTKVLAAQAEPLGGLLAGSGILDIGQRRG